MQRLLSFIKTEDDTLKSIRYLTWSYQIYLLPMSSQELMDLRVLLICFMADKEAHNKIPGLESRAPKLWDKVDRMYKYKQKGNEDRS